MNASVLQVVFLSYPVWLTLSCNHYKANGFMVSFRFSFLLLTCQLCSLSLLTTGDYASSDHIFTWEGVCFSSNKTPPNPVCEKPRNFCFGLLQTRNYKSFQLSFHKGVGLWDHALCSRPSPSYSEHQSWAFSQPLDDILSFSGSSGLLFC